jgi:hypothetical protein
MEQAFVAKTHRSKKIRRKRVEADTLPPTAALATAIMRTDGEQSVLIACNFCKLCGVVFCAQQQCKKNTLFLDPTFDCFVTNNTGTGRSTVLAVPH